MEEDGSMDVIDYELVVAAVAYICTHYMHITVSRVHTSKLPAFKSTIS